MGKRNKRKDPLRRKTRGKKCKEGVIKARNNIDISEGKEEVVAGEVVALPPETEERTLDEAVDNNSTSELEDETTSEEDMDSPSTERGGPEVKPPSKPEGSGKPTEGASLITHTTLGLMFWISIYVCGFQGPDEANNVDTISGGVEDTETDEALPTTNGDV